MSQEPNPWGRRQVLKETRSWLITLVVALAVVGIGVGLSAAINPLLDRRVHWDWTAGIATALFIFLVASVRHRWV